MNQSVLILADFVPTGVKNPQTIDVQDIELEKLLNYLNKMTFLDHLYIYTKIVNRFSEIKEKHKIIKAAGGLVKNGEGDYLFIFRLGKWDLPKVKLKAMKR